VSHDDSHRCSADPGTSRHGPAPGDDAAARTAPDTPEVPDAPDADSRPTAFELDPRLLLSIIDHLPVGVWVKRVADDGRYVLWNRTMTTLGGRPAASTLGRREQDLGDDDAASNLALDRAAVESGGITAHTAIQPGASDGDPDAEPIVCETLRIPVRGDDGTTEALIGIVLDETDRVRSDREQQESVSRYELAARAANDGLWDWNLRSNRCYFSARWKTILGYLPEEFGTDPDDWLAHVLAVDRDAFREHIDAHLSGRIGQVVHEHRIRRSDGEIRWVRVRGIAERDDEDRPVRIAGSITDITGERTAQETLRRAAYFDALTDLPNRKMIKERMSAAIRRRADEPDLIVGVIFFDFDRFKTINDGLGHDVGDGLLMSIGDRFRAALGHRGLAARMGGDEFVVIIEECESEEQVLTIASRLVDELAHPHQVNGMEVTSTASAGVVILAPRHETADQLLRDADVAMYEAKRLGRNRVVLFDDAMSQSVVERHLIENDLLRGIENREFQLRYQPIVALGDAGLLGFEALIRWHHPTLGMVMPDLFIAIAEETGLILPLGEWILDEALRVTRHWRDEYGADRMRMSVNLSRRQVADPGCSDQIRAALARHGLAGESLQVEVTESAVVDNRIDMVQTLESIRQQGVTVAMDDFGTGLSSLASLREIPLDVLKIDKAFVQRIEDDPDDAAVTAAIVTLAHNLRLKVVAEGVETATQRTMLRSMGCERGQGYLFAPPLVQDEAARWVTAGGQPMRQSA
jgi:diguanylate cyclase (GGDEF)-like protein/PAS domain S-box-containing protein